MKRLIIALALLIPAPAIAGTSHTVMKKGEVLASFKTQQKSNILIMFYENNVYRCIVSPLSYSCKKLKEI